MSLDGQASKRLRVDGGAAQLRSGAEGGFRSEHLVTIFRGQRGAKYQPPIPISYAGDLSRRLSVRERALMRRSILIVNLALGCGFLQERTTGVTSSRR